MPALARWMALGLIPLMTLAQDFRVSLSASPFTEMVLGSGTTFRDDTAAADTVEGLQRLYVRHGANEVYARIATTQKYRMGFGDHSLDRGLERARMAAALHLPFNPELGLFNIYGDIRCQPAPDFGDYPEIHLPATWSSLTLEQMLGPLRAYGALAARRILATGVQVRIWDLGNEIEFGFAGVAIPPQPGACEDTAGGKGWYHPPDRIDSAIGAMTFQTLMRMPENGRIAWLAQHVWPHEARMLAAVADGIRSVDSRARFSTHVSGVASMRPAFTLAFFKALKEGGFAADELGVSYYPTSSAYPKDRLAAFKEMASSVTAALGKPVFIAEFGYPAARMEGMFPWNDSVAGYPQTVEGQAAFMRDLVSWGKREKVLSGIRPWAPDLALSMWEPMSLFERKGNAASPRPALDALRAK